MHSLPNVRIFIEESSKLMITDGNGIAEISLEPGTKHFETSLAGYETGQTSTEIVYGEVTEETVTLNALNGLPVIQSAGAVVGRTRQDGSQDIQRYLVIYADVYDPDGYHTVSDVYFTDPVTNDVHSMTNFGDGYYRDSLLFTIADGGESALYERLGKSVEIVASDVQGDSAVAYTELSQFFVYDELDRDMITTATPPNAPHFRWEIVELDFSPVNYRFELKTLDFITVLDTVIVVIPDTLSTEAGGIVHLYTLPVNNGNYKWFLTLFDSIGNWSRSRSEGRDVGMWL